jgi:hypothetical protein
MYQLGILDIPNELIIDIFKCVDSVDIINLSTVCICFHNLINSSKWEQILTVRSYDVIPKNIQFINIFLEYPCISVTDLFAITNVLTSIKTIIINNLDAHNLTKCAFDALQKSGCENIILYNSCSVSNQIPSGVLSEAITYYYINSTSYCEHNVCLPSIDNFKQFDKFDCVKLFGNSNLYTQLIHSGEIFVDAQFGTADGIRNCNTKPFQTLLQAVSAAFPGDTIYVNAGLYSTKEITLANSINWYFHSGSVVTSLSDYMFIINTDGAINISIKGHGHFNVVKCLISFTGGQLTFTFEANMLSIIPQNNVSNTVSDTGGDTISQNNSVTNCVHNYKRKNKKNINKTINNRSINKCRGQHNARSRYGGR